MHSRNLSERVGSCLRKSRHAHCFKVQTKRADSPLLQRRLDRFDELLVFRQGLGFESGEDLAVFAHDELGEVPLDILLLVGGVDEESVEGSRVLALHVDLAEHREAHSIVELTEFGDFFVAPRLLVHELVGGESEHHQTVLLVGFVELFKAIVLTGEAALAGGVHDQKHLAFELRELPFLAVDGRDGEVMNRLGLDGGRGLLGNENQSERADGGGAENSKKSKFHISIIRNATPASGVPAVE